MPANTHFHGSLGENSGSVSILLGATVPECAEDIILAETPMDLDDVVDESLRILAPLAAAKGLFVQVDWGDRVPERVVADAPRLRQCLSQLLHNAIKFTAQGGIYVRIRHAGDEDGRAHLRFEVEDSGIGIEPDLMNPFEQGLGLAGVKKIVEAMQGEAGFRSNPGHGSLFHFHVLLKRSKSKLTVEAEPISVLIVAPTPKIGALWSTCFRRAGARVEKIITLAELKSNSTNADFIVVSSAFDLPPLPLPILRVGATSAPSQNELSNPLRIAELRRALTRSEQFA